MSSELDSLLRIKASLDQLIQAERASMRCCTTRAACDPGTSRARITTANARWARAAEDRDRKREQFRSTLVKEGF